MSHQHLRTGQTPPITGFQDRTGETYWKTFLKKESASESLPAKASPEKCFPSIHLTAFRCLAHPEVAAAEKTKAVVTQEGPPWGGSRSRYHLHAVTFTNTQCARVTGSWRFPPEKSLRGQAIVIRSCCRDILGEGKNKALRESPKLACHTCQQPGMSAEENFKHPRVLAQVGSHTDYIWQDSRGKAARALGSSYHATHLRCGASYTTCLARPSRFRYCFSLIVPCFPPVVPFLKWEF